MLRVKQEKKIKHDRKKQCVTLIAVLLVLSVSGVWYYRSYLMKQTLDETNTEQSEQVTPTVLVCLPSNEEAEMEEQESALVYVYLCGCVMNAGVYVLPEGSRLVDAIAMAGGFSEYAAKEYHNLARKVMDGERVYIPSQEELEKMTTKQQISGKLSENSGAESIPLVNINTASAEELVTLPGIGQTRANEIIEYRTKVGMFTTEEEIMNVSGIGEAMFEKMKDYITVQ